MDPDIAAVIQSLAGELTQLISQFRQLNVQAKAYAQALSPATVASFDLSLRNLNATIGQAFVPALGYAISVVERFAGIISPIAAQLAPVFHQLVEVIRGPFLNVIRTVADMFQGLQPAIQASISFFSTLVGTVGPIISGVAGILSGLLIPAMTVFNEVIQPVLFAFRLVAEVLEVFGAAVSTIGNLFLLALTPITMAFDALNEVMDSLHDITRAVEIVFRSAYDAIASWAKALIKSYINFGPIVDSVKRAFQEAAKQVIIFSAQLAKILGATGVIDALIANLKKEGQEVGVQAAPQNVAIKDFTQIARDMVQASFAAGPGGEAVKTERDYLKELIPILQGIKDGNDKNFSEFPDWIVDIRKKLDQLDLAVQLYVVPAVKSMDGSVAHMALRGVRVLGKVF